MNASADAGMVRITSLQPDDEFTFAPRRGRFKVMIRGGRGPGVIYQGLDAEAKEDMGGENLRVAMGDWWVWKLDRERDNDMIDTDDIKVGQTLTFYVRSRGTFTGIVLEVGNRTVKVREVDDSERWLDFGCIVADNGDNAATRA